MRSTLVVLLFKIGLAAFVYMKIKQWIYKSGYLQYLHYWKPAAIGLACVVVLFFLFKALRAISKKRDSRDLEEFEASVANLSAVDRGNGFEEYFKTVINRLGQKANTIRDLKNKGEVKTKGVDQGVDLISYEKGKKLGIQTKFYGVGNNVGNSAVQEITAAKGLYKFDAGIVVTNQYFTDAAIELAHANNVVLINRDELVKIIQRSKRAG